MRPPHRETAHDCRNLRASRDNRRVRRLSTRTTSGSEPVVRGGEGRRIPVVGGGRIRTPDSEIQSLVPYHLATPQTGRRIVHEGARASRVRIRAAPPASGRGSNHSRAEAFDRALRVLPATDPEHRAAAAGNLGDPGPTGRARRRAMRAEAGPPPDAAFARRVPDRCPEATKQLSPRAASAGSRSTPRCSPTGDRTPLQHRKTSSVETSTAGTATTTEAVPMSGSALSSSPRPVASTVPPTRKKGTSEPTAAATACRSS